jgi:4-amino-4-deoxy-L-arabinose transferase-like glycosyltransferase
VPLLVVRSWLYVGQETLLGPAMVAATFTFATVGLLAAALTELRGLSQGLLAGMVLLSTPFFILHGASLYADVPVAFFFLATVVLLGLNERHGSANLTVLAGLAAGLGLLVKHEGLLFALAVGASLVLTARTDGWKAARARGLAFSAGMLPPLLLLVSFKIAFQSPNDLLSTLGMERTLGRLSDPVRYALTIRAYKNHLISFGDNGFGSGMWLLTAYLLGLGVRLTRPCAAWAKRLVAALLLVLAAHFLVFVTMAHSLSGLLNSSLDRLLLQLWPSTLFLFFMVVRTPEEAKFDRSVSPPVESPPETG